MARTASAEVSPSRVVSRRVLVKVRRDAMTETPRVVWAHEVPILQVIYGEGEVREVDAATMDEGYVAKPSADLLPFNKTQDKIVPPSLASRVGWVFTGDPEAEYNRLIDAYGRHVDVPQPNVEYVYGRFAQGKFRDVLGAPRLEDCPPEQLRDLILSFGYTLPVETHESDDAERRTAREAWAKFRALDVPALVKLAEDVGVEIGR